MCYGLVMNKPKNTKVTFTPSEWEILIHRPEDCIVESELDTENPRWTADELWEKVTEIYSLKSRQEIDLGDELTFSIISNMISMNTWFDCIAGHVENDDVAKIFDGYPKSRYMRDCKAAKSIEQKVGVRFT